VQGDLEDVDGGWELRFTRRLPHAPEKVWRALTDNEHLAAWFPADIEGDRAAGAALRFVFREGEGPTVDGEMITYDPPRALEYRWGEDTLRFHVEPDGEGSVLTFVTVFAEVGRSARDAAGWHTCLDLLGRHLEGEDSPWDPRERWEQVHPSYVERFGPEASTIGPPEPPAGQS
jgi:uncharacterized protein YndB with AHSA1/START domain